MSILEKASYRTRWVIRKFADDAAVERDELLEPETVIDGNMLLTAGITELWNVFAGISGTPFSNANARIGVGDSAAAESAGQTDLQASTNKLFKAMSASYPQVSGASITFRAAFTGAEANYAWNEFAVDNGSGPAKRLNRKVSAQGTKTSGQTWTVDLTITLS